MLVFTKIPCRGIRPREEVDIISDNQTILLNSKEEFLQGAVPNPRPSSAMVDIREEILTMFLSNFSFERCKLKSCMESLEYHRHNKYTR